MTVHEAVTALTAIGALVFTGLSLIATRDQVAVAYQQNKVSEQGQYTDRYTKAVEQLDRSGHDHLQSRLGAVYALERLAHDSPRDQSTIIEVLSAFIRTSRPTPAPRSSASCPPPQPLAPDIQAALTVLGRRHTHDNSATSTVLTKTCFNGVDLYGADLRDADLSGADLSGADLRGANLRGANLNNANLSNANLRGANLSSGHLRGAQLNDAVMYGAILNGAGLRDANLNGADLRWANLRGADLNDAYMNKARLRAADLYRADLNGANLSDSYLVDADLRDVDLKGTNMTGATLSGTNLSGVAHDTYTVVDDTVTSSETLGKWW